MVDHYLQKHIIADLVTRSSARYAELKPRAIEGNVFTYHLQSLLKQKLICKNDDGTYSLTSDGQLYGINGSLQARQLLAQAHSIILLSIRDNDRWLLRRRLAQPMLDKVGFIHGEPQAGEPIVQAGDRILHYRTGLSGQMQVKGSGYICLEDDHSLIAYSHFTLLEVTKLRGVLMASDPHGHNAWYDNPNFSAADMIPSMADLVTAMQQPGLFFLDKTYDS